MKLLIVLFDVATLKNGAMALNVLLIAPVLAREASIEDQ